LRSDLLLTPRDASVLVEVETRERRDTVAQVREVTLKMSTRLVKKLEHLADLSSVSPETFIEGRLADFVRWVDEHDTQQNDDPDARDFVEKQPGGQQEVGYL
jgi:hypothetical protein